MKTLVCFDGYTGNSQGKKKGSMAIHSKKKIIKTNRKMNFDDFYTPDE